MWNILEWIIVLNWEHLVKTSMVAGGRQNYKFAKDSLEQTTNYEETKQGLMRELLLSHSNTLPL